MPTRRSLFPLTSKPVKRLSQTLFLLALLALLFFGVRVALFTLYWSDPENRVRPLESWMTLGFVAKLHQVPRAALIEEVAETFSFAIRPEDRITIRQLAVRHKLDVDNLLVDIEDLAEDLSEDLADALNERRERPR